MSSGGISPIFWNEVAFPLLVSRNRNGLAVFKYFVSLWFIMGFNCHFLELTCDHGKFLVQRRRGLQGHHFANLCFNQ